MLRNYSTYVKWFVVGNVPNDFVYKVLGIVKDFIEKVDGVDYLEIYFYGSSQQKILFIESEAIDLGVIAVGEFIAMHEAWRGWPRIHIDYEKCNKLRDNHLRSVVVHEISHAILHGSPIYYSVVFQLSDIPELSLEDVARLLYIATTIVKDMDVHEFLIESGMGGLVEDYGDFIAEQYKGLECGNIEDILNLVKALTTCIYTSQCKLLRTINNSCIDIANRVIGMLKEFREARSKIFQEDTRLLVKMLLAIIKNYTN